MNPLSFPDKQYQIYCWHSLFIKSYILDILNVARRCNCILSLGRLMSELCMSISEHAAHFVIMCYICSIDEAEAMLHSSIDLHIMTTIPYVTNQGCYWLDKVNTFGQDDCKCCRMSYYISPYHQNFLIIGVIDPSHSASVSCCSHVPFPSSFDMKQRSDHHNHSNVIKQHLCIDSLSTGDTIHFML